MSYKCIPWDQKIARYCVKYLLKTNITPNQLTSLSLILALLGSAFLTSDSHVILNIGAGIFVLARFLDHFDGELARQKKISSALGYYLDYFAGGISYAALFTSLGIQFKSGSLGDSSLVLGFLASVSALLCLFLNLKIDKEDQSISQIDGEATGYPVLWGFELEDGIYLLAPIAWLNWLEFFFIAASIGALIYGFWTLFQLHRIRQLNDNQ